MRFLILFLFSFFLVSCGGFGKVMKSTDADYKLKMAEQYFVKKKFVYAQQLYEDVLPFFKGKPEFEDIYYKYAYTAYHQRDYLNAENLFKTYLEIFPNSSRAEEIEYMRAYTFYKQSPKPQLDQTNTIKAMGMMQTFINTHPGSARIKEAEEIIEISKNKLETKDFQSAQLYFDTEHFRAAAVSFNSLVNSYPDSQKGDEYMLMSIRSYYRFAEMSVESKKQERFEKVVEESADFLDRYPQSQYVKEVESFLNLSQNNIKIIKNEPYKTTT